MMKLVKLTVLGVIFFGVVGCSGKMVLLKNDKGEMVKGEVTQNEAMVAGVINRDLSIEDCVKQYEAAGYRKVKN